MWSLDRALRIVHTKISHQFYIFYKIVHFYDSNANSFEFTFVINFVTFLIILLCEEKNPRFVIYSWHFPFILSLYYALLVLVASLVALLNDKLVWSVP